MLLTATSGDGWAHCVYAELGSNGGGPPGSFPRGDKTVGEISQVTGSAELIHRSSLESVTAGLPELWSADESRELV